AGLRGDHPPAGSGGRLRPAEGTGTGSAAAVLRGHDERLALAHHAIPDLGDRVQVDQRLLRADRGDGHLGAHGLARLGPAEEPHLLLEVHGPVARQVGAEQRGEQPGDQRLGHALPARGVLGGVAAEAAVLGEILRGEGPLQGGGPPHRLLPPVAHASSCSRSPPAAGLRMVVTASHTVVPSVRVTVMSQVIRSGPAADSRAVMVTRSPAGVGAGNFRNCSVSSAPGWWRRTAARIRVKISIPCATVPPDRVVLAYSGSTWMGLSSPLSAANRSKSFWVTVNSSLQVTTLSRSLRTFPVAFRGSASITSTCLGTLYPASRSLQNARISSASTVMPARTTR